MFYDWWLEKNSISVGITLANRAEPFWDSCLETLVQPPRKSYSVCVFPVCKLEEPCCRTHCQCASHQSPILQSRPSNLSIHWAQPNGNWYWILGKERHAMGPWSSKTTELDHFGLIRNSENRLPLYFPFLCYAAELTIGMTITVLL